MNDKEIMEGLLVCAKQSCDLLLHGSIESATPNVHGTFSTALNSALCLQSDLYQGMADKGWYPPDQAPQQKMDQVKNRFSASC